MIRLLLLRDDKISYKSTPKNLIFSEDGKQLHSMYTIYVYYYITVDKVDVIVESCGGFEDVFNCDLNTNDVKCTYFCVYPKESQ